MTTLRARTSDPSTSHEAAAMVSQFDTRHTSKILDTLDFMGEAGAEEIAQLTGLDAYAVRKRLPELQRMGLARPTGETRRTVTGRSERIWTKVREVQ